MFGQKFTDKEASTGGAINKRTKPNIGVCVDIARGGREEQDYEIEM